MGLQRYNPEDHNPLQWDGMMVESPSGEYYRAADVDALLARIRAAVEAEREAVEQDAAGFARGTGGGLHAVYAARAALAALLSEVAEPDTHPSLSALQDIERRHRQQKAKADEERAAYHEELNHG
jgi:hypothetical protein